VVCWGTKPNRGKRGPMSGKRKKLQKRKGQKEVGGRGGGVGDRPKLTSGKKEKKKKLGGSSKRYIATLKSWAIASGRSKGKTRRTAKQ